MMLGSSNSQSSSGPSQLSRASSAINTEVDYAQKVKEYLQGMKKPEEYRQYERTLLRLIKSIITKVDDLGYLLSVLVANGNDVLFAKTEVESKKPYDYV
jgi:hypothetical protein